MSFGVMMTGGKVDSGLAVTERQADDFYPTDDPEPVYSFLDAEAPYLTHFPVIWENACGKGDMARMVASCGHRVIGTDLVDRGYGRGGVDFLKTRRALAPAIITNPPYHKDLPEQFIRHALGTLGVTYLALLLKIQFFSTQGRVALYDEFTPAREYKIAWRLDFMKLGGGPMDFCWWVWDRRARGPCKVFLLQKPGGKCQRTI